MAVELEKSVPILNTLASDMLDELKNDILPFWMYRAMDVDNGGFYGEICNDLTVKYSADKGGILNSRVLWTFSSSYRLIKDNRYLKVAEHAYEFFMQYFWDYQYGGVFWMVNCHGQMVNDRKQAYNLAFAIYALSEFYRAVQNADALNKAIDIYRILENHFLDPIFGGYFEAKARDYSPIEDVRLSEKDRNDAKSMNTHLHILEAYTTLYRVWKDDNLKASLTTLLHTVLSHIVDPDYFRFKLFFNEAWECSSQTISYGHDIEGSWLLCEAAEVLQDESLKRRVYDIAVKMAYGVLEHGSDETYGGIYYEEEHGVIDTDKHWWPQAEAVVGFLNAYEVTGDAQFLNAACESWSFIKNYIIDKEFGEWFRKTDRLGHPSIEELKVEPWKCPYHNGRSCLEVFERIKK